MRTSVAFLTVLSLLMLLSVVVPLNVARAGGDSTDAEIEALKRQVRELTRRIDELERKRAREREVLEKAKAVEPSSIERYVDRRIQSFSVFNTTKFLVNGYGFATLENKDNEPSTFTVAVAPVFHYLLTQRVHFVFEPEFEVEEGNLEVGLEVGEADIFLNDYMTLVMGKMLLPFNAFGERLHPAWINKMPTKPLMYRFEAEAEAEAGEEGEEEFNGILPVLSDLGAEIRGGVALNERTGAKLNYAFWVTNGPKAEIVGEEGDEVEINFTNLADNNGSKAIGGRIGLLPIWNAEVGASAMWADAGEGIDIFLLGFDGEYHYRGVELRAEYVYRRNDLPDGGSEDVSGIYVQGAYRLSDLTLADPAVQRFVNRLEPVVRYDRIFRDSDDAYGVSFGLDYWVLPSVPLKVAYEANHGLPDNFLVQIAVGF